MTEIWKKKSIIPLVSLSDKMQSPDFKPKLCGRTFLAKRKRFYISLIFLEPEFCLLENEIVF